MANPTPPSAREGELDPELVSLKKAPARVGPVLALSVIALCLYVAWTTRHDLRYATRGAAVDLDAATTRPTFDLDDEQVTLTAVPDLRQVAWLRGAQATGHRLVPVAGHAGALWLQLSDDVYTAPPVYDLRFTGRMRRVSDTVFGDELAAYVAALPPQLTVIQPASLFGDTLQSVAGEPVALGADDPVSLDERVPGAALITLYANDHVKDEAGARAALAAANLPAVALARATERSWTLEIAAPAGLEAVRQTIAQADLFAAMSVDAVADKIIRHEGHWRDVKVDAAAKVVRLASGAAIPGDQVVAVSAHLRPTLPAAARVVIVGEVPGDYWYLFVLDGVLALVAAAMVWAGLRGLRDHRPPEVPLSFSPPAVPGTDA